MLGILQIWWDERREFPLDRRHRSRPSHGLDPVGDCGGELLTLVREHLTGEGGREGNEGGKGVDIVLDDLGVQRGQADQMQGHTNGGTNRVGAEPGQALLCLVVETVRDHLSDVKAEQFRHHRGHDDLVGLIRVGHPTSRHSEPVL